MTKEQNVHLLLWMCVGGKHCFTFFSLSLYFFLSCTTPLNAVAANLSEHLWLLWWRL